MIPLLQNNTSKYHILHYSRETKDLRSKPGETHSEPYFESPVVSPSLTIGRKINQVNHVFNTSLDEIILPLFTTIVSCRRFNGSASAHVHVESPVVSSYLVRLTRLIMSLIRLSPLIYYQIPNTVTRRSDSTICPNRYSC